VVIIRFGWPNYNRIPRFFTGPFLTIKNFEMILDGIRVSPLTLSARGTRYHCLGLFAYQRWAFLCSKMHTYSSILDFSASLLFSFRNLSNNIFESRPLLCSLQIAETPNAAFAAAFCLFGEAATQR
jgi:hypothetical protein